MSFMFNPYPYDDTAPVNRPALPAQTATSVVTGEDAIASHIVDGIIETQRSSGPRGLTVVVDGYISAEFRRYAGLLARELVGRGITAETVDVSSCYRSREELDELLAENLPEDREADPVLLFGRLFEGGYDALFDAGAVEPLVERLTDHRGENEPTVVILYGAGACHRPFRGLADITVFLDVTPKRTILRIKAGRVTNLGDPFPRPYKALMRRCYYFDFELAARLRAELLREEAIDYYVTNEQPGTNHMFDRDAFDEMCKALTTQPFRCKPVYNEGVWGGYYTKRLRRLPEEMRNCAWVFDLIPLEVSVLVEVGDATVEIPFFTFVSREGVRLMGRRCVEAFGGYFPIRFNYDDTFHSNGNMSIQVHPTDTFIKNHFGEHGRQDESYYVVATGHGAKTHLGLVEGADADEFFESVHESERNHTPIDYSRYVNHVPSTPGTQFLIPAGTIHSSGRNQVVLEIGSLTVGSYTFKLYDYLRRDLDGKPRPIHSRYGSEVLHRERTSSFVDEHLVQSPRKVRAGDGWAEYVVGDHELLYFTLRRYEFAERIEGDTAGTFHVLALVDGERVAVYAKDDPSRRYVQGYLDIVVVPAEVGPYVIENLGDQPVCVHKTHLKDDFERYL